MIEFIDLKDGRIFNGDSPYIFWFENGQSVNLNYVRKICFIANKSKVRVRIDSEVFSLLNLDQDTPIFIDPEFGQGEIINEKKYVDLSLLKTKVYTSVGYKYDDFYVHMIYILGCSQNAGEIHDYFTITENIDGQKTDYTFEIAADFYIDNELLKNQLENFDISIPESIQKAIYEVDVHEESNDNITLNRKYKELLMNYWNIVANKGSYNSLQNSLAWFEWGDLVRIEEIWNRHYEGMKDYFLTDLNRELDDEFIKQFLNNSKTTYIGLYMALSKLVRTKDGEMELEIDNGRVLGIDPPFYYQSELEKMANQNESAQDNISTTPYTNGGIIPVDGELPVGNYVYVTYEPDGTWPSGQIKYKMVEVTDYNDPDGRLVLITDANKAALGEVGFSYTIEPSRIYQEPNPRLTFFTTKWQMLDLCLKMTLLGNFYATYFMPIHMDLIHSTLEHWVFTNTIKILHTNSVEQYNIVDQVRTFDMECDEKVKMMDHFNYPHSDTLFLANKSVYGYEDEPREELDPDFQTTGDIFKYPMGGTAGVVTFAIARDNPMLATDENDYIIFERVVWFSDGDCGEIHSQVPIAPIHIEREGYSATQYIYDFNFMLAFTNPGKYQVNFEFRTTSGNVWTTTLETTIEDTTYDHIKLYKVEKTDTSHLELEGGNWEVWLRCFQMKSSVDPYDAPDGTHLDENSFYHPYKEHSIYLKPFQEKVGFNHTIIFNVNAGEVIRIEGDDERGHVVSDDRTISNIDELYDTLKNSHNGFPNYIWVVNEYPEHTFRVLGICREYDVQIIKSISKQIDGGSMQPIDDDNLVMNMRFHPCMHQVVELEDDTIQTDDLIYVESFLKYSRDIDIDHWEFKNMTTQESFTSYLTEDTSKVPGGSQGYFFAPQTCLKLDSGYYNVYIHYKKGETLMKCELNSAFVVAKK